MKFSLSDVTITTLRYRPKDSQFPQSTTQASTSPYDLATEPLPKTQRWEDIIRKKLEKTISTTYCDVWRKGLH
eukprot:4921026-Amphidinium_carterae.1